MLAARTTRWAALAVGACLSATSTTAAGATLEEEIGQLLMVGFRGATLADDALILRDIELRHLGGVILYNADSAGGSNIDNPEQLHRLTAQLRAAAPGLPLLIAVDQEGGSVRRLREPFGFGPAPTARQLGEADVIERTTRLAVAVAEAMVESGLNLNLAPVVDLDLNPDNPVIGALERSYGATTDKVVRHASAVVRAHRGRGVLTVLKHFPGHGSAETDSHRGLPDVTRVWRRREVDPFARLIEGGLADAVMTAHLYNLRLDADHPATLSAAVIGGLLRGELGFSGVVITDDLQMEAITSRYGEARAVELALEAGADILVFGNHQVDDPRVAARVSATIQRLVKSGELDAAVIHRAYDRVVRLKARLRQPAPPPAQ